MEHSRKEHSRGGICPCEDDGEKLVEVGELRLEISGFISGGDGMLDDMEFTLGIELSIVTELDSMESEKIK